MTTPDPAPRQTDNGPRPEDGDQSKVSQDPNDDYSVTTKDEEES